MKELNETLLPDDYPVFYDYIYVADGIIIKSDIQGTVLDLKRNLEEQRISHNRITSCDITGRQKREAY